MPEMIKTEKHHEPFVRISKRVGVPLWKNVWYRFLMILVAMIICAAMVSGSSTSGKGFFDVYASMFSGIFGTTRRFWIFVRETSLLLCVSLALVPAFKMKFWNLGGNGQILIGCLASAVLLFYCGGKIPDMLLWILMLIASILASAIWACIPAIFKAFFKTNESLFTLMQNYIAAILVAFFISFWYPKGTGAMDPLNYGIVGLSDTSAAQIILIVTVVLTVAMSIYLRYSKHGYELSVVGESENTARYIGINVKTVVIRTVILSGAVCGLVGFLLTGIINHTVSDAMDANMGFTGIMVAWLAKFSPAMMAVISLFIGFLTRGMAQVRSDFKFSSEALSDVVIGLIYFFIIASEFFITYKLNFRPVIQKKLDFISNKVGIFFVHVEAFFENLFYKIKSFFLSIFKKKETAGAAENSSVTTSADKKEDK